MRFPQWDEGFSRILLVEELLVSLTLLLAFTDCLDNTDPWRTKTHCRGRTDRLINFQDFFCSASGLAMLITFYIPLEEGQKGHFKSRLYKQTVLPKIQLGTETETSTGLYLHLGAEAEHLFPMAVLQYWKEPCLLSTSALTCQYFCFDAASIGNWTVTRCSYYHRDSSLETHVVCTYFGLHKNYTEIPSR